MDCTSPEIADGRRLESPNLSPIDRSIGMSNNPNSVGLAQLARRAHMTELWILGIFENNTPFLPFVLSSEISFPNERVRERGRLILPFALTLAKSFVDMRKEGRK